MTTLERECASRATNDRGSEIDALRRTVEALTADLAERDQRIERLAADLRIADESQVVYGAELSEARERIATLEQELHEEKATIEALMPMHDRLATAVAQRVQAEQERDAIQETLAAVEHEVAIVYCHITGSRISKCNTLASVVISEADDFVQKDIDEAVKEAAEQAEARVAALEGQYYELLYAVANKYPDETRHQTALRYIRQAEAPCNKAKAHAALAEPKEGA